MKVLVIWTLSERSDLERKEIANGLSWALEKGLIEDILFMRSSSTDFMQIINFTSNNQMNLFDEITSIA